MKVWIPILITVIILIVYFSKSIFTSTFNKIALIFHVGNIKVFNKIIKKFPNFFNNKNITLFISCNNQEDRDIIKEEIPNATVFLFKNKGMDIGPFLLTIQYLIKNNLNYDYYIKIHTKQDDKWRNDLIKPLYNNLRLFLTNKSNIIEMYGAARYTGNSNFLLNYPHVLGIIDRNYPHYKNTFLKYCKDTQENCITDPDFIAGTIFAFNKNYFNLLKQIVDIEYEYSLLEEGHVNDQEQSRANHSWEYFLSYLIQLNNLKITLLD